MRVRGGAQRIPRPADATPGGPPPWGAVPESGRAVDLDEVCDRVAARGSGNLVVRPVAGARPSAVLVAMYEDEAADGAPTIVLTRRPWHIRTHAGEVCFPGGRAEEIDGGPVDTALREADEEISLEPSLVEVVGELDHLATVSSGAEIVPVVARLTRPPRLEADRTEVDAILRVPMAELLLDEVWREERWCFGGVERDMAFFELVGDTVWGATARMLRQLLAIATGVEE
ncbi:MAG: CoA pyrophosphatase [Actinomycetota bacterium]|nr:CoA pyrophosphatase [Actinomycetota bacterium]